MGLEREGMMADPRLQVALLTTPSHLLGGRAPVGTQEAGRWAVGLEVHPEFQRQEDQMIDALCIFDWLVSEHDETKINDKGDF